jgi:Mg2+ and Co2+ transporter CorA
VRSSRIARCSSRSRPELEAIASSESADRFEALRGQLESVVQAARESRDAVVGSFEILIARNEHRTNEIMKVLTLASILLLPGSLIAGIMGMNFKLGIFQHNVFFWIVLGGYRRARDFHARGGARPAVGLTVLASIDFMS